MNRNLPPDLRTARFWRHWALSLFSAIGFFSVVLGLAGVIFPNVLPHDRGFIAVGVLVVSLIYGSIHAWPRVIELSYSSPNMTIRIIKGDLFDQPGHLVIGMCDTFDTSIPVIIDKRSIQGQFLERIFGGNTARLDSELESALTGVAPIDTITKPGKETRYPLGTVATLTENDRRYFCVAYTTMNGRNEARGSVGGIFRSLECLWEAVCAHANGENVNIPVIGGGQARISQVLPAQDSIRLMILSFILASRREKICDGLSIIVRNQDYEKIERLEIQDFLQSMRQ
jgi:hypothetical protein